MPSALMLVNDNSDVASIVHSRAGVQESEVKCLSQTKYEAYLEGLKGNKEASNRCSPRLRPDG